VNRAAQPSVLVERTEGTTRVTLNRVEKANALDAATVELLYAAIERACSDGTRMLVLAGAGPHFCAGFDFTGVETMSEGDLLLRFVRIELMLQALWHAPIATVALVQGGAFGAGADLVCACEQRVGAPNSRYRMPGLKFGLALGTRRLAERIGAKYARLVLGAAAVFDADEALKMRFLDSIVPPAEWPEFVQMLYAAAATLAPDARIRLNRITAADSRDADLAELVRSASQPGLKTRIKEFRSASR
jgi:enoyl-CoA hydratase/carnithine racemase